jgi:hypothetical protein
MIVVTDALVGWFELPPSGDAISRGVYSQPACSRSAMVTRSLALGGGRGLQPPQARAGTLLGGAEAASEGARALRGGSRDEGAGVLEVEHHLAHGEPG